MYKQYSIFYQKVPILLLSACTAVLTSFTKFIKVDRSDMIFYISIFVLYFRPPVPTSCNSSRVNPFALLLQRGKCFNASWNFQSFCKLMLPLTRTWGKTDVLQLHPNQLEQDNVVNMNVFHYFSPFRHYILACLTTLKPGQVWTDLSDY